MPITCRWTAEFWVTFAASLQRGACRYTLPVHITGEHGPVAYLPCGRDAEPHHLHQALTDEGDDEGIVACRWAAGAVLRA